MSGIHLGLDFGSYQFRAAYWLDGELVPVPLASDTIEQRMSDWVCYPSQHLAKPAEFRSLKYELSSKRPIIFSGQTGRRDDLLPRDHIEQLLVRIRQLAEDYSGEAVVSVSIAVPAGYSEHRRSVLRECAQRAGFGSVQLINDCTAAVIGHCYAMSDPQTVLVYSSGYQSLECGLIRVVKQHFREIVHDSLVAPSGRKIDEMLMETLIARISSELGHLPTVRWSYGEWFVFQAATEMIKKQLSVESRVIQHMPLSVSMQPLVVGIERESYEQMLQPIVDESVELVARMLDEAQLEPKEVDLVLLSGGTTRISLIQDALAEFFGKAPILTDQSLLARGTAVHGYRSRASIPPPAFEGSAPEPVPTLEIAASQALVQPPPDLTTLLTYVESLVSVGQREEAIQFIDHVHQRMRALLS